MKHKFNTNLKIANFEINQTSKPFVVAEISANHNGDIEKAKELIFAAKEAGADAVKIQTYTPDTMTLDHQADDFKIVGGLWDGYTLYELYKEAHTPFEWHEDLFEYARSINITIFSSPFDETAVDLLNDLDAPAYKIASFEVTDLPLIEYVAHQKKPIIVSTGMANEEEISQCLETIASTGNNDVILLHCVSGYPTPYDQYNIKTIQLLSEKFLVPVGISDHTLGTEVSVASLGFGVKFIEKHFTLSRSEKGPDSAFSLEPQEFQKLTREVKNAWKSFGIPSFNEKDVEKENIRFRRSIYVTEDINPGEALQSSNIKRIRPGFGLHPKYFKEIIGKKAVKHLKKGSPLQLEDYE